jgi:hypothetical protein
MQRMTGKGPLQMTTAPTSFTLTSVYSFRYTYVMSYRRPTLTICVYRYNGCYTAAQDQGYTVLG